MSEAWQVPARLEALLRAQQAVVSSLEIEQVLQTIVTQASAIAEAPAVRILLLDEEAQVLRFEVGVGLPPEAQQDMVIPVGESFSGEVVATGQPVMVPDVRTDPRLRFRQHVTEYGLVSHLGLPLMTHERVIGVLVVNTTTPRSYTAAEISLLSLLAQQAAIAIENARLHSAAVRRGEELESLLRATRTVMSGVELQGILDRIVTEAAQIAGTPHVRLMFLDQDAGVLRVEAEQGKAQESRTMPLESLSGLSARTGEPVFSGDTANDPRNPFAERHREVGIVTHLSLPIKSRDAVLGVLTFNTLVPREYRPGEIAYLAAFADQAAIAIEHAHLYEATQRELGERARTEATLRTRSQQLETVRAIGEEIARELDLRALLDLITRRAVELVGTSTGMLRLWDEGAGLLVPQSWVGMGERRGTLGLRLGEGVAGTAAQLRRGLVVNDFRHSRYATAKLLEITTHTAVLAEPLLYRDQLVGVITLNREESGRPFEEEDRQLLGLFATQAAIAIQNARLHEETRRRASQLTTLNELTQSLTTILDPVRVAQQILAAVQALIPDSAGRLWGRVSEDDSFQLVGSVGLREPEVEQAFTLSPNTGLIGIAAATKQPIISPAVTADPRFADQSWAASEGLVSCVVLPLLYYGEWVVGFLSIFTRTQHDFSSEELDLLRSFGTHAAIAIENARLYMQVQEYAVSLERRVVERTKDLEAAQLQVVQSEKLASVGTLAAGVAHELNQPLMVIRGYAQELLVDPRIIDEEVREDLRRIEAQTTRMTAIITHLRDFSRQSKGKRQTTDLNLVVTQALTFVGQQLKLRNIAVAQALDPALPTVWADPLQLEQVLLNLVTNARDAMEGSESGVKTLTIRTARLGDGQVNLSVTDTGPGIPPEVQPRIFDPFFTTKEVGRGTGLGLSICHGIVQEHGGEIQVESPVADGRGSRITLVLPRSLRDAEGPPDAAPQESAVLRGDTREDRRTRSDA
jgi:GAF domain-containing protein